MFSAILAAFLTVASVTHSQAILEPPNGLNYYCAWLDTADSAPGAHDGDRPVKFINRTGFSPSVYQYAQNMPPIPYEFPIEQVWATNTDAHIMLTVYPQPHPWNITDADIDVLAQQVAKINQQGRGVFLRFAPEHNGNWFVFGQRPVDFIALWRRVTIAVRAVAPRTAMVWGPNPATGYPYGVVNATGVNFAALDTNNDGVVNSADDAYAPYYPGDEYVDWVGLSVYHFGTSYPWEDNTIPEAGKFERLMNDANFYQTYSVDKKKPFMLSEGAATFFTNTPRGPGDGEFNIKRAWWRQYLTNPAFLDAHPNLKLQCNFEFYKPEETYSNGQVALRDFRISNKSEILNAYVTDLGAVKHRYIFANCVQGAVCQPARGPMAIGGSGTTTNGGGSGTTTNTGGNTNTNKEPTPGPSNVPSAELTMVRHPTTGVILAGLIVSVTALILFQF